MSANVEDVENSQNTDKTTVEEANKDVEVEGVVPGFATFDDYVKVRESSCRTHVVNHETVPASLIHLFYHNSVDIFLLHG